MHSLGTDFDTLLTGGALCALAAAACWAVVVLTAVTIEATTSGRVRLAHRTGCPPAVRIWLLGLFVAVFSGLAPANASGLNDTGSGSGTPDAAARPLDGLPLPDRVVGAPPATGSARPHQVVVVQPGDSLWRIARRLLPRDAADPAVVTTVASVYADNRVLIGPDPDLIRPGQRLIVRSATTTSSASPDPSRIPEEP